MAISELPDDVLWKVLSAVRSPDLDAPEIQITKTRSIGWTYDPQLVALVFDLPLVSAVCAKWTAVVYGAMPLETRRRIRTIVSHHAEYVMTTGERYCRRMQLHAAMPHLREIMKPYHMGNTMYASALTSDCVIIYFNVLLKVISLLRAAYDVHTCEGRLYSANLHRVVSDGVYYSLLCAFERQAGMLERNYQARCYYLCIVARPTSTSGPVLQLDRALTIAKKLQTHPALCRYVLERSKDRSVRLGRWISKYRRDNAFRSAFCGDLSLPSEVANQLSKVPERSSANRRILPVSFGLPRSD